MLHFDLRDFSKRFNKSLKSYITDKLQTCDKVWIRVDHVWKPLEAPYSGLYTVLQQTPKDFLIKTNDNINTKVSVDRFKPYIEV